MTENITKIRRNLIPKDRHQALSVFCGVVPGSAYQSSCGVPTVITMRLAFATIIAVFVWRGQNKHLPFALLQFYPFLLLLFFFKKKRWNQTCFRVSKQVWFWMRKTSLAARWRSRRKLVGLPETCFRVPKQVSDSY